MLVVLRGPSGSGKSTVARLLQERLEEPAALLQLDHFRRVIYREKLDGGDEHIGMLGNAAQHALSRGHHVIIEGILDARRYSDMLAGVAAPLGDARFYAFDLTFEQTLARHASRSQTQEFGEAEMRAWYLGWQPLDFVTEHRIGADEPADAIVDRIITNR